MKNIIKWKTIQRIAGIIALVAAIGLSMAACDDDNSPPSINGTWGLSNGFRCTISGSTGTINAFGSTPYVLDAANKDYIRIGSKVFQYINNTNYLTWSGEQLLFNHTGDVCNNIFWSNCTFTLSSDGNTLQIYTPAAASPYATYTRR